jgi:L-fuculose-phosphate aldolase
MNPDTSKVNLDSAVTDMRAKLVRLGAMLFDRQLTDAAGGNMSARVGDLVCITPRYAGSKHQWQLHPDQILVVDLDGNLLDGEGELSRESKVHLKLHRELGHVGTGVIHAHARNVLVFAALCRPMPPVLEGTLKFGEIPVAAYAPAHSTDLAEHVVAAIAPEEARIRKQAAAAIAAYHGLFVMGKDIDAAFDAVERIEGNAYAILMGQLLSQSDMLAQQRAILKAEAARYGKE